ncbi:MAG TPA: TonB family protein [Acidisarcina sp.]
MALTSQLAPQEDAARSRLTTPAAGALLLHIAVFGSIFVWAFIQGHLHHDYWGADSHEGAIQATLVSHAPALPLPQEQPPTPNVLATETPSPAPVEQAPQPRAAPAPERDAVPIPIKQPPKVKLTSARKAQEQPSPPTKKELTDARAALHPQPVPRHDNRAQYGESAPQMARSMTDRQGPPSTVTTPGSDFGTRFAWYVDVIKRKVAQSGHQQEVDPRTPAEAHVSVIFNVNRDGAPGGVEVEQSSGSPSLDSACIRAVQRVDTFGPLPAGYSLQSLGVHYHCDNSGFGR